MPRGTDDIAATDPAATDPAAEIQRLRSSVEAFARRVSALTTEAFLRPHTDWSPRDVTAHLIGWNVYTLSGCRDMLRGVTPFYLADAVYDFRNVNAASVRRYNSANKDALVEQLRASADTLLDYLMALAADEWERDTGLREPDGRPLLVRNDIAALTEDYAGHAQEIASWIQE